MKFVQKSLGVAVIAALGYTSACTTAYGRSCSNGDEAI